jgi:hypothetical protein
MKYWDENEARRFATAPYGVVKIFSFLTSAESGLLRDHIQRIHDDMKDRYPLPHVPLEEINLSC